MEARITLVPASKETGGHYAPSLAEMEVWMREQGIQADLDLNVMKQLLEKAGEGLTAEGVVARGTPPTSGKDGYLEYLVDFSHVQPTVNESGEADMRASLIQNVSPGDPLAIIHAPTGGRPGLDVCGKLVAGVAGKTLEPRLGLNTQRSPNDPMLIIASAAGHVRLHDKVVEVQEFYTVEGDVDYATGNITFGKSVLVRGDVKGGFNVDAGGDLEVTGLVEDCNIKAQGKVMIRGGFTGQGKGLLRARGDVTVGYVRNQAVKSEKNLVVLKEAVNSRLQARQAVTINGMLAGGKVQARQTIICQTAGTETGTPTHLEAGFDYTVAEEMSDIRTQMDQLGKYSKKLGDSLRHIHDMERLNRGMEPWTIEILFQMESARSKVEAKSKDLRERFSRLEGQSANPDSATITVFKKAFPGVCVKIGHEMYLVQEPMTGPKTFFVHEGAIQVR